MKADNSSRLSSIQSPWFTISMILFVVIAFLFGKYGNLEIFQSTKENINKQPTSTMTPLSTQIPSIKVEQYISPTLDPDPIVDCKSTFCDGGKVRKSECDTSTCCQINDKWIFYKDKNKCLSDQKSSNNTNPTNSNNNSGCQKVQYTTKQGITNGTYYCCDDKVNEISRMEQQIQIKESAADICYQSHLGEMNSCMSGCSTGNNDCYHNCAEPFLQKCGNYIVGDMRTELMNKLKQYCP